MKRAIVLLAACALTLAAALPALAQRTGPKIFISVDMEGIWGVVHGDQVSSTSPEYGPARRWMAEDVNAVVTGLLEGGAGRDRGERLARQHAQHRRRPAQPQGVVDQRLAQAALDDAGDRRRRSTP